MPEAPKRNKNASNLFLSSKERFNLKIILNTMFQSFIVT